MVREDTTFVAGRKWAPLRNPALTEASVASNGSKNCTQRKKIRTINVVFVCYEYIKCFERLKSLRILIRLFYVMSTEYYVANFSVKNYLVQFLSNGFK